MIIPTYGRPEYLAEALASVKAQSYAGWECIVVDDCSPRPVDVPEWVTLVHHRRNLGPGVARNTGVAHASGDLVTFLDDDDWFHPDRFRWAVDEIGDARTHICRSVTVSADGTERSTHPDLWSGDMRDRFTHSKGPGIGQCVHRAEDIVPFDATMRTAEDTEWWVRMSHSAVFASTPAVGHWYRDHGDGRYSAESLAAARRRIWVLNHDHVDRVGRGRLADRVATSELGASHRAAALWWSARAFALNPRVRCMKIAARSLLPDTGRRVIK